MNDTVIKPQTAPQKPAYGSAEAGRLGGLERARRLREAPLTHPERRLLRVREQLDRLDKLILAEKDPQRIDRLASAQARLAEQERILDGRPLPGSHRPRPERAAKAEKLSEPW
jgi:hypothetical protein